MCRWICFHCQCAKQQQVCVAEHFQHKHKAFAEKYGKHLIQKAGGLKSNYVCWFVGCSGNSQAQEAVNSRRVYKRIQDQVFVRLQV